MLQYACRAHLRDYSDWIMRSHKRIAYLGRYAQGLGVGSSGVPVEQWPLSKIGLYIVLVSEIVEKENDVGKNK